MIVQAISLLDDLDKELNIYAMRVKEWYGWHFPELAKILNDNILYARTALKIKSRGDNPQGLDLSDTLPEDLAKQVGEAMMHSMGTEISVEDVLSISALCEELIALNDYRAKLFEYLKNRMNAIAPNLSLLVGELVGARLISHAGSLINLAKQPSSTLQILGAEKALFRALKAKVNTPKYGLLYHASLVGQASTKNKGKIARSLAAKCALATRVDALSEKEQLQVAGEMKQKIETRLQVLETMVNGTAIRTASSSSKPLVQKKSVAVTRGGGDLQAKVKTEATEYDASQDVTVQKKRKRVLDEEVKQEAVDQPVVEEDGEEQQPVVTESKKKKKKVTHGAAE
jgi:nucleolar protein 58